MATAILYLGHDLRWQVVAGGIFVGVLEALVFLEADDHGGRCAVVGADGGLAAVARTADQLADVVAGLADRPSGQGRVRVSRR